MRNKIGYLLVFVVILLAMFLPNINAKNNPHETNYIREYIIVSGNETDFVNGCEQAFQNGYKNELQMQVIEKPNGNVKFYQQWWRWQPN